MTDNAKERRAITRAEVLGIVDEILDRKQGHDWFEVRITPYPDTGIKVARNMDGLVHVTLQWGLVIILPPEVPREQRRRWWGPSIERYTLRENTILTNYLDDPTIPQTVIGVAS